MRYVDVERLLVGWLHTEVAVRCVTDLPADLAGALPVIRVGRIGGADVEPTIDRPTVDIECFATGRQDSGALSEQVRSALRFALPGTSINGSYIARVDTVSGPAQRPYDNTNVVRYAATYSLRIQSR